MKKIMHMKRRGNNKATLKPSIAFSIIDVLIVCSFAFVAGFIVSRIL